MDWLARKVSNRNVAWAVVALVVALSLISLSLIGDVEHEDDILAFLPRNNPDVEVFYDVNQKFGSLDLALVGIESEDVFDPDFLLRLRRATQDLKETRGLDHVLSLTNVVDFTPNPEQGGIITAELVQRIPKNDAEKKILKDKVMSRGHVVGNLVSVNAKAVLIYCYLAYGSDPRTMADDIRKVINAAFPQHHKYWGGGPFISTYIYNATQEDIRRLTPWAVLAIVLILMLTFRDIFGVCLVLLSTGMGILLSLGVMACMGVRFNIVLGSMPVILFAIGSAYGIHILSRYYGEVQKTDCEGAIKATLSSVGPTVLAAGLTTAAGLLSFVLMDIQPLRTFGLYTAVGILATLILSVTFIPAVARVSRLARRRSTSVVMRRWMVRLSVFAQTRRLVVGMVLLGVVALGLALVTRVNTSLDPTTFFSEGSPPDQADKFLAQHFGGSQFIQIHVKGDMDDPHVLRELQRISDHISLMPHVTSVLHVGNVVAQSNEALAGQRRIPDTVAQVRTQYSFLAHDPSMVQLVTQDRQQALIHIKVDSSQARVLTRLLKVAEDLVASQAVTLYKVVDTRGLGSSRARARLAELVSHRIVSLAREHAISLDADARQAIEKGLTRVSSKIEAGKVKQRLSGFLHSDECVVDFSAATAPSSERIAEALVALGPGATEEELAAGISGVIGQDADELLSEDLAFSLTAPLDQMWKEQRARQRGTQLFEEMKTALPDDARGERFLSAVAMALLDLDNPSAMVLAETGPGAKTLSLTVTGLPVMHRGLSHSATQNQVRSLIFALALVVLIMTLLFRSFYSGLLVAAPIILTLVVIYGGMGLLGVNLDIGTAMLASLILGAGVDYAVHLASAWRATGDESLAVAAARAADDTGPAIWTNAIMVCAGFFVLTLGEARPLKNVGSLTAAAMVVAALATFLAIPVLARKRSYRKGNANGIPQRSEVVESVLEDAGPKIKISGGVRP